MADIATFTSRESVINAALRALEKEGINITLPSLHDPSLPDTEEVKCFIYKTRSFDVDLYHVQFLKGAWAGNFFVT